MIPIFLDFETYWSQTHSLTKMHPITYVTHPDTEIQSVAIKIGEHGKTKVLFGYDNIQAFVWAIDWSDKLVVGHNLSGFDSLICAWKLGIRPKAWGCTAAMARPMFAKIGGVSLKSVASKLKVGKKLNLEATNTKGKYLADFSKAEIEAMREYNKVDTDLCAAIFYKLAPMTTTKELKLIDMTIRMLTDPKFIVNEPLLQKALVTEAANKRQSILEVANIVLPEEHLKGLDDDSKVIETKMVLASAPKFVTFLTRVGEEIPMKPSPSNPDKQIPALAKTDQGFIDLTESSNPLVSAAAQARLDVKSTILETRIKTFLEVQSNAGGRMPIALNYYGADTTGRWSGSFKMNQQNLPRVNPKDPKLSDVLRKCLQAPEGYKVVVADLSGIELRVNHFLWKVKASMDLFIADPDGADLYIDFASVLYEILFKDVTKEQRQVGKVAHLGLGFGAGSKTFQTVAKLMGGVELTEGESKKVVDKWRDKYWDITEGWKTCHSGLKCIFNDKGHICLDPWGLCYTTAEGIQTPVGMIRYPHLRKEYEPVLNDDGTPILNEDGTPALGKGEWWYGEGRNKTRIYAGKITENIVQHLARGVIADMALSFSATPLGKKYNLVHTVHDELIYIVKDEDAKNVLDEVQKIMKNGVTWWPELITSSEGDIAQNYGDAK